MKIRILSLLLCLLLLLPVSAVFSTADEEVDILPSAALIPENGGGSISAGQTFALLLNVSGSGWVGIEATLHYDPQLLTVGEVTCLLDGWSAYLTDDKLIVCSDTTLAPLEGQTTVCSFLLRVSENAESGSELRFRLDSFKLTDGKGNHMPATPTFTKKVAPKDSDAARLKSLNAGSFELTPAFDPDVFEYTVTGVPVTVASLGLAYEPKTDDLTVTPGGDSQLHGGRNTMTLTVDAPDGASVTYTVTVIRDFDGDYEPSTDAALRELTLTAGTLSPAFSPDVLSYLVVLPNEAAGSVFTAGGNPRGEGSLGVTAATALLEEGDTELKVICTAESGEIREYLLTVLVLPPYDGVVPYVSGSAAQTLTPVISEQDGTLTVSSPYVHPEATYNVVWTVDGKTVDEGRSLKITDELRGKTVVATITGTDGFEGESSAEYKLPAADAIRQIPLSEKTLLFAALALALVLGLGVLIGIPAGRAAAKRKLRRNGYVPAVLPETEEEPAPEVPEETAEEIAAPEEEPSLIPIPEESVEEPQEPENTEETEEIVNPSETPAEDTAPDADLIEALLFEEEEHAPDEESDGFTLEPSDFTAEIEEVEEEQELLVIYDDGSEDDSRVVRFDDDGNGFTNVEQ